MATYWFSVLLDRACACGVRGRHRRRRHLVLEPLSRRALRFGELFLRLLLLAGAAARNGTGRSISPPQPETLRYLNHVADKFDLRRDIQFRSRVTAAHYEEATRSWDVTLEDGSRHRARFLITAIGPLSAPTMPRIEGVDTFKGQSFHTARWPQEPVSFAGKRVAVIGTGATGVQTIQEVAKTAGHLTVFQRTPNWCAPLHNGQIDAEDADARSRPAIPRSSSAARRPSPASSTRRTRAAPSR